MRKYISFDVDNPKDFKHQVVQYCRRFKYGAVYDSCDHYLPKRSGVHYHSIDFLAGLDHINVVRGGFDVVQKLNEDIRDWLCGYWSYDLKNDLENLCSVNRDGLNFDKACFYQPRFIILQRENRWVIGYLEGVNTKEDVREMMSTIYCQNKGFQEKTALRFKARVDKDKYCRSVEAILDHIHRGDVYELNYCIEFYAEKVVLDPFTTYNSLVEISPTPFSGFFKAEDHYILCASPERFVKKEGGKIISQPIKGTAQRGKDKREDTSLKRALFMNAKERSENIMIVDLVRNDLSHIAEQGSVGVEELCGVYAFPQVFQMISTVTATLHQNKGGIDAIRSLFPAGSMTGAPKVRAMELIEKYEESKRGVYAGAIGYFSPDGDFDFNVVIRTLLYNAAHQYVSFMVGSAITQKSVPQKEYEECLLKAKAIFQLFNQDKQGAYE
ncbi:anthranilate synthase component I family protein [Saccharicrinis fermentans]|uniref:Para-aminobenzoate synthase component 1 n=1 Tax=Saccharicrinis fermentans DSM 9555 = JCM 21142 TaxID=869213 RepID=W7Y3S9_9BACT|nr:anthranilate synthase component I family protein [Saccharicrinis fermentans]GAF02238.1 para-aminobenzoate synthase component 1 [Saccharicrinis fermentans DSM 9555 = JCM 21142]